MLTHLAPAATAALLSAKAVIASTASLANRDFCSEKESALPPASPRSIPTQSAVNPARESVKHANHSLNATPVYGPMFSMRPDA